VIIKILKNVFILVLFFHSILSYAVTSSRVELDTSKGAIVVELYNDKAPRSVANFLNYVKSGFYNGFIFHRVEKNFVIQSGAYDKDLVEYETNGPIRNEATNGLKNLRGTIAMARFSDPNSADSQFFINLSDNTALDFKMRTPSGYGYCVFGQVVQGMDVVDAIGNVETHAVKGFEHMPVEPVIIKEAKILEH